MINLKCTKCNTVFPMPNPEPRILACPTCRRYQGNLKPTKEAPRIPEWSSHTPHGTHAPKYKSVARR